MEISFDVIRKQFKNILFPPKVVLGRAACVGLEVINAKNLHDATEVKFINLPKARLDLLLDWLAGQPRPQAQVLKPHMLRHDIFALIKQESKLKWLGVKDPEYLFMDTWSELADQKYTHRQDGWSFAAVHVDVKHSEEFKKIFSYQGLLKENQIAEVYERFFKWFAANYPQKKIVIVNYSAKYDPRIKIKERTERIRQIIAEQAVTHDFIHNLKLDDTKYFLFPFHYLEKTIDYFIEEWDELEKTTKN